MRLSFSLHGMIVANDFIGAAKMANGLLLEAEKRTGQKMFLTLETMQHGTDSTDGSGTDSPDRADGGGAAQASPAEGPHPGDDFAEDSDGVRRPAEDAPKRRRGRPSKAEGTAPSSDPVDTSGSQGSGGDGPVRADTRAQARDGSGDKGTPVTDGNDAPFDGDRDSDRDQAGLDDWNDDDVTYTIEDVAEAMSKLRMAMGSKADRQDVKDALVVIAGVDQPRLVPEEGYAKVIVGLGLLAQEYESGRKKLPTKR